MANRVGQQFGNYRLVSLLGYGGFAEVYLGEHQYLKTQAAHQGTLYPPVRLRARHVSEGGTYRCPPKTSPHRTCR